MCLCIDCGWCWSRSHPPCVCSSSGQKPGSPVQPGASFRRCSCLVRAAPFSAWEILPAGPRTSRRSCGGLRTLRVQLLPRSGKWITCLSSAPSCLGEKWDSPPKKSGRTGGKFGLYNLSFPAKGLGSQNFWKEGVRHYKHHLGWMFGVV